MNIQLPDDFINLIKDILGDEFDAFLSSYETENHVGLRYNPLKCSKEQFLEKIPFKLQPVLWAKEGFYYEKDERPGKSPYHEAGAYYIQEPSAMSAVELLDVTPGDFVLDMCAAPGGKSTQIAGKLLGKGLLVSSEFVKDRAKILSQNIERFGVRNACVLNETPKGLSSHFSNFFNKILVDAPCSGEGMFKKEESAIPEWSLENVKMCHDRQMDILEEASLMLRQGGTLVFSTCTFNNIENEGTVKSFLEIHPEFELLETKRLWPHKDKGEGHFVAKFVKAGTSELPESIFSGKISKEMTSLISFMKDELTIDESYVSSLTKRPLETFGENLYLLPEGLTSLKGLKVERPGLHVAVSKKNRFEPAHSLALALTPSDVKSYYDMNLTEAAKYIAGETISCGPSLKGWILMCVNGFSIGWGKASGGIIKNHYPKGLRR